MPLPFSQPLPGIDAHRTMASSHRQRNLALGTPKDAVDAAVLVMLTPVNAGSSTEDLLDWTALLIRRNNYPGVHSGQIALPGGKREPGDADLYATACREAFEEVGVNANKLEPVGALSTLYVPPSNFCIHPFLVLGRGVDPPRVDGREVVDYKYIPVRVFNPGLAVPQDFADMGGVLRPAPAWRYEDYVIWGATAMILAELYCLVSGGVSLVRA